MKLSGGEGLGGDPGPLARQTAPIFRHQGIPREARRLHAYFRRAQHDPQLPFASFALPKS